MQFEIYVWFLSGSSEKYQSHKSLRILQKDTKLIENIPGSSFKFLKLFFFFSFSSHQVYFLPTLLYGLRGSQPFVAAGLATSANVGWGTEGLHRYRLPLLYDNVCTFESGPPEVSTCNSSELGATLFNSLGAVVDNHHNLLMGHRFEYKG